MEMESQSTDIFNVALQLYYNPSIWPDEFSDISISMLKIIHEQNINTLIERGVIAVLNFLVNRQFKIALCEEEFADDLEPAIPDYWRNSNSIATITLHGVEKSIAQYYAKRKEQTFFVGFYSSSRTNDVLARLIHSENHQSFHVVLLSSDLYGLSDPQHGINYALHIVSLLDKGLKHPIERADDNLPPSGLVSPINLE